MDANAGAGAGPMLGWNPKEAAAAAVMRAWRLRVGGCRIAVSRAHAGRRCFAAVLRGRRKNLRGSAIFANHNVGHQESHVTRPSHARSRRQRSRSRIGTSHPLGTRRGQSSRGDRYQFPARRSPGRPSPSRTHTRHSRTRRCRSSREGSAHAAWACNSLLRSIARRTHSGARRDPPSSRARAPQSARAQVGASPRDIGKRHGRSSPWGTSRGRCRQSRIPHLCTLVHRHIRRPASTCRDQSSCVGSLAA
jgi:hypothetical protein